MNVDKLVQKKLYEADGKDGVFFVCVEDCCVIGNLGVDGWMGAIFCILKYIGILLLWVFFNKTGRYLEECINDLHSSL